MTSVVPIRRLFLTRRADFSLRGVGFPDFSVASTTRTLAVSLPLTCCCASKPTPPASGTPNGAPARPAPVTAASICCRPLAWSMSLPIGASYGRGPTPVAGAILSSTQSRHSLWSLRDASHSDYFRSLLKTRTTRQGASEGAPFPLYIATSLMCVAIHHSLPKASLTAPLRSP